MEHHAFVIPSGETITVTHLTRHDWGGGPLRAGHQAPMDQFIGWVLHHTVMAGPTNGDLDAIVTYMRRVQSARPDLGGEVPYSTLPFRGTNETSAVIVDGRGPGVTGAHTAGLNSTRYAWSLPGDYRTERPSLGQVWAMRWIAHQWTPRASVATIGHQQAPPYISRGVNLNATACPGGQGLATLPLLQPPFVALPPPTAPTTPHPSLEDDDMMLWRYPDGSFYRTDGAGNRRPVSPASLAEKMRKAGVPEIQLDQADVGGFEAAFPDYFER